MLLHVIKVCRVPFHCKQTLVVIHATHSFYVSNIGFSNDAHYINMLAVKHVPLAMLSLSLLEKKRKKKRKEKVLFTLNVHTLGT